MNRPFSAEIQAAIQTAAQVEDSEERRRAFRALGLQARQEAVDQGANKLQGQRAYQRAISAAREVWRRRARVCVDCRAPTIQKSRGGYSRRCAACNALRAQETRVRYETRRERGECTMHGGPKPCAKCRELARMRGQGICTSCGDPLQGQCFACREKRGGRLLIAELAAAGDELARLVRACNGHSLDDKTEKILADWTRARGLGQDPR